MADKGRILVVEKNDVTRRLITGILSNKGYETYEARDATEALGYIGKNVCLILLDVEENPIDSEGFVKKVDVESKKIPMVIMADGIDSDAAVRVMQHGVFPVLSKPVVPDKLLKNVENNIISSVGEAVQEQERRPSDAKRWQDLDPDDKGSEKRAEFMRRAIDLSQDKMHENCGGPFGAVIVRNGQIIAEGWNAVTSTNDPTAHAEMMAIRQACEKIGHYSLEGCEIYTSCEPCPMCLSAIYWAHIDRIFYANTREDAADVGFDDDYIYREVAMPFEKRSMPSFMMLRDEAQIVFGEWRKKPDKVDY